jgi:signal transduction histidine kinase/CheY-like chemotaxis protein
MWARIDRRKTHVLFKGVPVLPSLRCALQYSFALTLLLPARLSAASPAFDPRSGLPVIRNFTPDDYHAHNQIFSTAETSDGTLYFATYGTVVSFDGARWRKYPVPGAWVRALAVGPDGLVYVGGVNTLGRLEPDAATGLLHFVSLTSALPEANRAYGTVWSAASADGGMCFGVEGAILRWRDGKFRAWEFPGERPALRSAGGEVFGHLGARVLHWHDGEWQPWIDDPRLAEVRRVVILPASRDAFLLVLDNGTILRAPLPGGAVTVWPTPAADFFRSSGIRNATQLPDGSYAFTTAGEGVVFLAANGAPLRHLTAATGLASPTAYGLACARNGTLWIETANGISALDPQTRWSVFDNRNGRPDGIGGEPTLYQDTVILLVSDHGPVRLVLGRSGLDPSRLEPISGELPPRISNIQTTSGNLYGGSERGLMRLDGTPKLIHPTASPVEHIYALTELPHVIAIGMLHGIEMVRVNADDSVASLGKVAGLDAEITESIALPGPTLWFGTTAGAAIQVSLKPDGSVTDWTRFDESRGLPAGQSWVRCLADHGSPLIVVREGVFTLSPDGKKLIPHPAFVSYHPAGINTLPMDTDGAGRFWFQIAREDGNYETGCLETKGGGPQIWTPLDPGIEESLGYGGARIITYLREPGGEFLWISGTRASVRVDLNADAALPRLHQAVISEIIQGEKHWSAFLDATQRSYSREPLRILFSSPSLTEGGLHFETRLLGYDANWNAAPGNEATFTNLMGGPFTFEVRTRDATGRPGEVARTTFSVAPPWHRSPLAYSLYVLASVGAVAGFVRWRLGQAVREQHRLEALVATRTTELATARDRAEAASHAKSTFLASMSHELRTPLNGVIGYAQILQNDPSLATEQRERVRIVHQSGEHLLRMINDVLDLAKIEAGKIELRPAAFALGELIVNVASVHASAAMAKRLTFTSELESDLPVWVEGDPQKIRQILDNLLGNAVKFTERGDVTLRVNRATDSDGYIHFAVTDTGPGIAASDQARLFRPFEQARASRPAAPGTGLGLAISQALVERMGGSLEVESAPGTGSRFSFSIALPTVDAPTHATIRATVTGYEGARRHVLIVDDHAVNRQLLTDLLGPLGFSSCAADSGEHALARLEPWPDLAIIDLRMEPMDGLELTRRLRALPRGPALRILLTSASVISFDLTEALAAGCDDFLPKPFRIDDLVDKMGSLLGLHWRGLEGHAAALAAGPIPEDIRLSLRDVLAQGDIGALRAAIMLARTAYPEAAAHWDELDTAAAGYQLSHLRKLLYPS